MTELVSRLLEAIDERRQKAIRVQGIGVMLDWPRRNGKDTLRAFLEDNDPASIVERCEADRELVEMYVPVAEYEDEEEWAGGRAAGLGIAVRLLARSYGISVEEETTGE